VATAVKGSFPNYAQAIESARNCQGQIDGVRFGLVLPHAPAREYYYTVRHVLCNMCAALSFTTRISFCTVPLGQELVFPKPAQKITTATAVSSLISRYSTTRMLIIARHCSKHYLFLLRSLRCTQYRSNSTSIHPVENWYNHPGHDRSSVSSKYGAIHSLPWS